MFGVVVLMQNKFGANHTPPWGMARCIGFYLYFPTLRTILGLMDFTYRHCRLDALPGGKLPDLEDDCNGRFLALLSQLDTPLTIIPEIKVEDGTIITLSGGILQKSCIFYSRLYSFSSPSDFDQVNMQFLLASVALGWLLDSEHEFLVHPITPEKVLAVINSFPSGKAPCPDGLTIEFYISHGETLTPETGLIVPNLPC